MRKLTLVLAAAVHSFALLVGVALLAFAAYGGEIEDRTAVREIAQRTVGCPQADSFLRLVQMTMQNDVVALNRLYRQDGCYTFGVGDRVFLEGGGPVIGCVRPAGQVTCYWTALHALRPIQPAELVR